MSISSGPGRNRLRRATRLAARQGGAIMVFVLLAALLIAMVTLSVMRLVAGDITEGFGGLEAVQAFNVAEAGSHYAMGKLAAAGAGTYAGETITIMNGTTTLGTATITVNCIDALNPAGALVPPCSTSTYPGYRRVISTSTLPMSGPSGGPTRTIVAVVQALSGSTPYGLCGTGFPGYHGVNVSSEEGNVNSDIGSNTDIYIGSTESTQYTIRADTNSPQAYTGKATYTTSIFCGGYRGSGGCPVQVQGGTFQSSTQVCSPVSFPSGYWSAGGGNLTVGCGGYTINSASGFNFNNINVPVIATPNAPTVTVVGATGTTTYSYYVVAVDICGNRSLASSSTQITTGYTPLDPTTNYNHITWTAVPGAVSYDVLKNTTNALLGNTTATTMNDTGQSTTSFNNNCTFNDLRIQADPSNPSATQVVYVNGTLTMGACTRLVILGAGKVDLRLGKSSSQVLIGGANAHFGVLSTDTASTPAPITANRFTVDVNSSAYGASTSSAAVYFQTNSIVAGTFNVPNGEIYMDGGTSGTGTFYGAIQAGMIYLGYAMYSDTSGTSGTTYSNFTNLKSWKDQ